jgi:hypothetical protein
VPPVAGVASTIPSILSNPANQDDMGFIKIRIGKIKVVHNKNKLKIEVK